MNVRSLSALLVALPLSAAAVAAAPQYAVVDLGSTTVAGAGLVWQTKQATPRPDLPSSGGNQCLNGTPTNYVYAQYGTVAAGQTCEVGIGGQAALWSSSGSGPVTLTDLGTLPGSNADVTGPYSVAFDFNDVGDIVGASQSNSGTYHPGYPYVAIHGFLYHSGSWTDLIPIAGPEYGSAAESVNSSHEVVGSTNTRSSSSGAILTRAFVYINGTMYNLSFYLVGGPTVLLTDAYWIDCQGNIAATGTAAAGGGTHNYLLIRQGAARTTCPN